MANIYTSLDILETGLQLAGFEWRCAVDGPTNLRRFSACFGASHSAIAALWDGLRTAVNPLAALEEGDSIIDLLITMLFYKVYGSEHVTVALVTPYFVKMDLQMPHETFIRKTVWRFAAKLQAHKEEVIVWPDWEMTQEEDRDQFLFTVDGVHFRVQETPHDTLYRDPQMYSFKFKSAGLDYQLCIAIRGKDFLVHCHGPVKASTHDLTVWRDSGVEERVPFGKFGIGDSAYGSIECIAYKNPMDDPEVKKFKARALARHESYNKRLKNFGILDSTFRHDLEKHRMVVEGIMVVLQYSMRTDAPLFEV